MRVWTILLAVLLLVFMFCLVQQEPEQAQQENTPQALSERDKLFQIFEKPNTGISYAEWLKVLAACREINDTELSDRSLAYVQSRATSDDITIPFISALATECLADLDSEDRSLHVLRNRHDFMKIMNAKIASNMLSSLLYHALDSATQEKFIRLVEHQNDGELLFVLSLEKEDNFSLINSTSQFSPRGKAATIRLIGLFQDKRAMDLLKTSLSHTDGEVRLAAVWAIGEIGTERADVIEKIEVLINDWKSSIVIQVIRTLVKLKDYNYVPILGKKLVEQANFTASPLILNILEQVDDVEKLRSVKSDLERFARRLKVDPRAFDNPLLIREMPNALEVAEGILKKIP